jgi:hypothetical protein
MDNIFNTTENVFDYITREENSYKTTGVPIVDGYEWKMFEHIRLSILYKNSKFSTGADDGNRPFKNIIRPILNVAYRSEGFDVKDIMVYVNDAKNYYKSFLVKKFHNKWARKNDIDTFIDEMVESYVDFGGVLVKNVNEKRPEVVPLPRLAFCDQTDILAGAICEKHMFSPDQLLEMAGKWNADRIDEVITLSKNEKTVPQTQGQKAKTPGKYIEVYELHGMFPETWLNEDGNPNKYTRQLHIITFYKDENNKKNGITLFSGKESKSIYKLLKRDPVYGRALGFGGIEELFEPQVWTNYNAIQIKEMLDVASLMIAQTADKSFAARNRITDLKKGEIVYTEENKPLTQVAWTVPNMAAFDRSMNDWELTARTTGSANDPQLGVEPNSGTAMGLQEVVVNQGQGIHDYRRGKIATFMGEIYRDWGLQYLVNDINKGDEWVDELDLKEMQWVAERISENEGNKAAVKLVLNYLQGTGEVPSQEALDNFKMTIKEGFKKDGNKKFLKIIKDEFKDIPIDVEVNIAGKQKDLVRVSQNLSNVIGLIIRNPMALANPPVAEIFNQLFEAVGMSPVDFSGLENMQPQMVGANQNQNNQQVIQ